MNKNPPKRVLCMSQVCVGHRDIGIGFTTSCSSRDVFVLMFVSDACEM